MQVQPCAFTNACEVLVSGNCDTALFGSDARGGLEGLSSDGCYLAEHITSVEGGDNFAVLLHLDLSVQDDHELLLVGALLRELSSFFHCDLGEDLLGGTGITAVEAKQVGDFLGHWEKAWLNHRYYCALSEAHATRPTREGCHKLYTHESLVYGSPALGTVEIMRPARRFGALGAFLLLAISSLVSISGSDPGPVTPAEAATPSTSTARDKSSATLLQAGLPGTDSAVKPWEDECYKRGLEPAGCLTEALDKLPFATAVEAFATTITALPTLYGQCHPVSHQLGERAYRELDDISKAVRAVSDVCEDGMYHGVFQAWGRVKGRKIASSVAAVCGDINASIRRGLCSHGLGHALWSGLLDVTPAIQACREHASTELEGCVSGVTMSFVQSSASQLKNAEDVAAFCRKYPKDVLQGCLTESGPLLIGVYKDNAVALSHCKALASLGGEESCVRAVGMTMVFYAGRNVDALIASCKAVSLFKVCLQGAIRQLNLRPSPESLEVRTVLCKRYDELCGSDDFHGG